MHALAAIAIALTSGLHGMVMKGPLHPVCRQGQPCTGPAQVTLLFKRGAHTYRTRSTAAGSPRSGSRTRALQRPPGEAPAQQRRPQQAKAAAQEEQPTPPRQRRDGRQRDADLQPADGLRERLVDPGQW